MTYVDGSVWLKIATYRPNLHNAPQPPSGFWWLSTIRLLNELCREGEGTQPPMIINDEINDQRSIDHDADLRDHKFLPPALSSPQDLTHPVSLNTLVIFIPSATPWRR
jgi:hypothetical protein